ncbi:MAG: site-specific DNA-methyltransferase, partial [bacterium]
MPANTLYYGDNIDVLREYLKDETVDLVYLDPPFNSKRDYNLLFKTPAGHESESQVTAFVDSWHWGEQAEAEYSQILHQRNTQLAEMMRGFRSFLGENDVMAYLTMMANRLLELHRVMKPTASIYLHCDPTASHYLKLLMDAVFGAANFRNEIVWCYKSRPQSKRYFGRKHDTILFYTKSDAYYFDWESVVRPLSESTVNKYRLIDENGRKYRLEGRGITGSPIRSAKDVEQKWEISHPELVVRDYLDEKIGVCQEDWWTDINIINQSATERLG